MVPFEFLCELEIREPENGGDHLVGVTGFGGERGRADIENQFDRSLVILDGHPIIMSRDGGGGFHGPPQFHVGGSGTVNSCSGELMLHVSASSLSALEFRP